jgi:hypothetical protein
MLRCGNGLYAVGNTYLLNIPIVGFLSSFSDDRAVLNTCCRWALSQGEAGHGVMCGNLRGPEKAVFDALLAGIQPVILVLASGIPEVLPEAWMQEIGRGRLLIVSPFDPKISIHTRQGLTLRDAFIMQHCASIVVGYERPGGALSRALDCASCDLVYLCG